MDLRLPHPQFMPCARCGASVARDDQDSHECDGGRLVDYTVVQLRPELEAFEGQFAAFLDTPHGRFEAWYAEYRRAA